MTAFPHPPATAAVAVANPRRPLANLRSILPRFRAAEVLLAACLVFSASAVVSDERLQDWIPEVLTLPDDAEVVTDRAIGSTVRMFSIATGADIDDLFADWEEQLNSNGYPVTQGADELLDQAIEFSGPGISNAKILVAPATTGERNVIEFDATLN
ncbi:hypothetical protein [Anianabacter salinae]|uniref:hypothetical protein n=1 Tax=Anianabacter salinae TaxID=2851023 RepID=UPI00225DDC45|nr:hypothetical protein [Anianabacter salinae]MBV0912718.1 hypothetical protein [Anianabacter salinae]